jgi:hypothetical protein
LRFSAGPLLSEGREDIYEKIFERDLLRVLEHVSQGETVLAFDAAGSGSSKNWFEHGVDGVGGNLLFPSVESPGLAKEPRRKTAPGAPDEIRQRPGRKRLEC